jgi:pyridoxine 5-phosphate synthase
VNKVRKIIRLGLNIDHVATLREQRKGLVDYPDIVHAARICMESGADLITIHLRGDRRHIQDHDLVSLSKHPWPINLEMAATAEMIDIALKFKPHIVCLVPENREELTTEGGLNVIKESERIKVATKKMHKAGIKVSLFIEAHAEQVQGAIDCQADAVEFHTGHYALAKTQPDVARELKKLRDACELAHQAGLQVHAGHGLDYKNIAAIKDLPYLEEVNIGHAIICESVFVGLGPATKAMKELLK